MPTLERLAAREILDSRGRPTVLARCELVGGSSGSASVPAGASTGSAEAHELRDGEPGRYRGLGCRQAVRGIEGEMQAALAGRAFDSQQELDLFMIDLDGTPAKVRLGANALLAVSLAWARAVAMDAGLPLYRYLAGLVEQTPAVPRLTVNLFSGGKHAGGQVPIQDVLLVPLAARGTDEALATVFEVYQCAVELVRERYGTRALTADEGGLAPPFASVEAMFDDALSAIERAGFTPGVDVALAVDVAASHFFHDGSYHLGARSLTSPAMIDWLETLIDAYPIVSVEDGLAEDDWSFWPALRHAIGGRTIVLGDDLLCTNPQRIRRAAASKACDALLLKPNQIGTLTEAAQAYALARSAGWSIVVSARSGETEDDWLADLAVGWAAEFIKVGSITQSERLAKYNRLLDIEGQASFPGR